jgi:DNA-binding MarR family transcriptional regulator
MKSHQELLISLRKVIRAIDLHSKHLNKTSGLTSPQLLIMLEIDKASGVNSSQIAKSVNLSAATVTNIIDRLESKELILRVRSTQDKRKVGLYLTEKGSEKLLNAPQPLQDSQMPATCRCLTRVLVPIAAVGLQPLQYVEVACPRRSLTCVRIPFAAVIPCPAQ